GSGAVAVLEQPDAPERGLAEDAGERVAGAFRDEGVAVLGVVRLHERQDRVEVGRAGRTERGHGSSGARPLSPYCPSAVTVSGVSCRCGRSFQCSSAFQTIGCSWWFSQRCSGLKLNATTRPRPTGTSKIAPWPMIWFSLRTMPERR